MMVSAGHRFLTLLGLLLFIGFVYLGSQQIILAYLTPVNVNMLVPYEVNIPFVPQAIFVYYLEYFLPLWLFAIIKDREQFLKMFMAFVVMATIHGLFYVFCPIVYHLRPEKPVLDIVAYLYTVDAPINTFPSMHVSIAFLSYFVVRQYRPQYRSMILVLAVMISVSTVLVKQHYILDVISGFFLAWGMKALFMRQPLDFVQNILKSPLVNKYIA